MAMVQLGAAAAAPATAAAASASRAPAHPARCRGHATPASSTHRHRISGAICVHRRAAAPRARAANAASDAEPPVAAEGDVVTLHWRCLGADGAEVDSSRAPGGGPATFVVGAGDVVGNRLFEAFDEAVRGQPAGAALRLTADGGAWDRDLLFKVPRSHPEITRLEGRYASHGGVAAGLVVELANGAMAVVVEAGEDAVVLDANSVLAGKKLTFELELLEVEKKGGGESGAAQ